MENRILRSSLSCLEEQLRLEGAAADPFLATSNRISIPSTRNPPANPKAAASSGTDSASADVPEQIASQVNAIPLICRPCSIGQFRGGCSICT